MRILGFGVCNVLLDLGTHGSSERDMQGYSIEFQTPWRNDTYCAMALPSIMEAGMVVNGRGKEKRGATRGLCRTRSVETLCRAPKGMCLS